MIFREVLSISTAMQPHGARDGHEWSFEAKF